MNESIPTSVVGPSLRVSALGSRETTPILVETTRPACRRLAEDLGILDLKKLRLEGRLRPVGRRDWRLDAHLGATVVQACVVTLAPVTTRIDEPVTRIWRAEFIEPEGDEVEMPEEVHEEPLGAVIDIGAVMVEALELALPLYPRAADAGEGAGDAAVTEPGKAPLTDEEVKPFAGLAGLRDKLRGDPEKDG